MRIEIESSMMTAAREVDRSYQPVFRGVELETEAYLDCVSLRNLRVLLKAGLQVASIVVVERGDVLIVFQTGETYLALGFAVGEDSLLSNALATFAHMVYGGSRKEWANHISGYYEPGYVGIINPNLTATGSGAWLMQ